MTTHHQCCCTSLQAQAICTLQAFNVTRHVPCQSHIFSCKAICLVALPMREQHSVTLVAGHMAVSAWAYADYRSLSLLNQPTELNTMSCILAGAHWHCRDCSQEAGGRIDTTAATCSRAGAATQSVPGQTESCTSRRD